MAFDPKKIDRLAAKATLLEEQVAALVKELEELAEAARAEAAAPAPAPSSTAAPAPAPAAESAATPDPGAGSASEAVALTAGWKPAMPEPAPEPEAVSAPEPDVEAEPEPEPARPASSAPEGARLVALNMALRGTPRDETARYLRENYDFDDSDALLDDVYEKAGS